MSWLAFDIGGANLKAADGVGWALIEPFALWRAPDDLPAALARLIRLAPRAEHIAITMTGELCDCFQTKADGVRRIVAAVEEVARGLDIFVYLVDGRFVSSGEACDSPLLAAASNWHALAQFACRFVDGAAGLLVDIGSTTTDIIPLVYGQPRPTGFNDTNRLVAGELVYTGVSRTPICVVTKWLPWRGVQCPVAAELFATTADAYLLLNCIDEQPDANWTADGQPLTWAFARARLGRMICADSIEFKDDDAIHAAAWIRDAQAGQLHEAMHRVVSGMAQRPETVVVSGAGEFLVSNSIFEGLGGVRTVSLTSHLGREAAVSATAHSLATLAREFFGDQDSDA
jgi:(4-(4-[2-(gamma-L-glutamylamino)ethyl]phenoxymethyl)furan-2-yl)methanamine synthase